MLKRILFTLAVFFTIITLNAQEDNFAEDTVSANFEAAITCPTIDSIIQLAFAKKPVATYKYGAAGPNHFDCSGFVYYCFGQYGIKLPRSSRDMFLVGQKVKKEDLQPGDLVFFSRGKLEIGHVGIVVSVDRERGSFTFIHASVSGGVMEQTSSHPYFMMRYMGARRLLPDQE